MSAPTEPQASIPAQLPMTSIEDVGHGWRRVSIGEPIKSSFQCYSMLPQGGLGIGKARGWQLGAFYTREGYTHLGAAHYREAVSLRAWCVIALPLAAKLARGYWKLWRTGQMV